MGVSAATAGPSRMSLLLDIRRLRAGVEEIDRRFEPSAFEPGSGDFRVVARVDLRVTAHKDGKNVRLTGRVLTTLECACSRCLEPFPVAVDAAVDGLFLPAEADPGQAEQEGQGRHQRVVLQGRRDRPGRRHA